MVDLRVLLILALIQNCSLYKYKTYIAKSFVSFNFVKIGQYKIYLMMKFSQSMVATLHLQLSIILVLQTLVINQICQKVFAT